MSSAANEEKKTAGGEKRPTLAPTKEEIVETESGQHVYGLKLTAVHFLNKLTLLYGPTKSGKTHMIRALLHALKDYVHQVLLVSAQEASNKSFDGIIPPPLVWPHLWIPDPENPKKQDFGVKGAERFLQAIWNRQEMMASIYALANEINTLAALFSRLPEASRARGEALIRDINAKRKKAVESLKPGSDTGKDKSDMDEKFTHMLRLIYKKFIKDNATLLTECKSLTEKEKYSLEFIDFNPNIVVLLEDVAADLKPLNKKPIFRKFFYQGRHVYITCIISAQDDTDIDPNLRKNAGVSIFTTPEVAETNFTRTSNKRSKSTVNYIKQAIPAVFAKNHRKLVHLLEDGSGRHIYHLSAPAKVPKFTFGSKALQELCEKVKRREVTIDKQNPYHAHFKLTI